MYCIVAEVTVTRSYEYFRDFFYHCPIIVSDVVNGREGRRMGSFGDIKKQEVGNLKLNQVTS